MTQLDALNPTSELEAVNAMLRAVGEAPIAAFGSGHPDETMALELLKEVVRETCTRRWRFNTEYNYTVASAGTEGGRNVFEMPAGLASWSLALTEAQRGIDIVARQERAGVPSAGAWIFADRLNGTDGHAGISTLDLNVVWMPDFEEMPQSARSYITIAAGRRFAAQLIGFNQESAFGFTQADEERAFAFLLEDQREAIPVVPLRTTAGTELDAVNQMLMAANLDPIISVASLNTPEEYRAVQVFRDAEREVQTQGWRFNTDLAFELEPFATYAWVGSDGDTTTLNLFQLSDLESTYGLLSWAVSPATGQVGGSAIDLVERMSLRYTPAQVLLYDRLRNRDGLEEATYPRIYLDVTWLVDYADAPEVYRRYVSRLATQRFLQTLPSETPVNLPWTERDVQAARRELERQQGSDAPSNIFNHPDAWEALGRRSRRSWAYTREAKRR